MSGTHGKMMMPRKGGGGGGIPQAGGGAAVPYSGGEQGGGRISDAGAGRGLSAAQAKSRAIEAGWKGLAGVAEGVNQAIQASLSMYGNYEGAKAQKAFNEYETAQRLLTAELDGLEGEGALGENGVQARIKSWREEAGAKYQEELTPWALEMFNKKKKEADARTDLWAIQKTARENKAFLNSVSEGAIANARERTLAAPDDLGLRDQSLGEIQAEIEKTGAREGWGAEKTAAEVKKAWRSVEERRLGAVIDGGRLDEAEAQIAGNFPRGNTIGEVKHNPLNLKKVKGGKTRRAEFEEFKSDADGFRAAWRQLLLYNTGKSEAAKYQVLDTPKKMVKLWAPPSENNLEKYFKTMIENGMTEASLDEPLDMRDPAAAAIMIKAMAVQEGPLGRRYSAKQIEGFLRGGGHNAEGLLLPEQAYKLSRKVQRERDRLEAEARGREAGMRAELDERLRNSFAMLYDGIIPAALPGDEEIAAAFGDKAGKVIARKNALLNYAVNLGAMREMDGAKREEALAAMKPAPDEADYELRHKIYAQFEDAARRDQAMREKDPIGYIGAYDKGFQAAREEFFRSGQGFEKYKVEAGRALGQRGMDRGKKWLSEGDAKAIAGIIEADARPLERLKELERAYGGRDFKEVMAQAAPHFADSLNIAVNMKDKKAAELLIAAARDKDFYKKAADLLDKDSDIYEENPSRSKMQNYVVREMTEIAGTLQYDEDTRRALNQAARLLAVQYMIRDNTLTLQGAVKRAVKDVALDRYEICEVNGKTFRAPKGAGNVEQGAIRTLRAFGAGDFSPVNYAHGDGRDELRARHFLAAVKSRGYWVTNEAEDGLILCFCDKAVWGADGKRIERKFEELGRAAAPDDGWYDDYQGVE